MLSLACRDTAARVIECDYVAKGTTEEELWRDGTGAYSKGTWHEN